MGSFNVTTPTASPTNVSSLAVTQFACLYLLSLALRAHHHNIGVGYNEGLLLVHEQLRIGQLQIPNERRSSILLSVNLMLTCRCLYY